jgi:hypothetical protein
MSGERARMSMPPRHWIPAVMQPDNAQESSDSVRTRVLPGALGRGTPELDRLRAALAGRYSVEREIGAGGMGRVYLATDLALERRVALKTILPEIMSDAAWVARFRLEAASAAGLQHPNLVQVYEILQVQSTPVLVMEYVAGDSLARAIADRRLGQTDVCRIMASVCDGIAHAHAHGVIHCDVKPGNVLLSREGVPKVGDFGLAVRRAIGPAGQAEEDLGQRGVAGSPAYMSPEQISGDPRLVSNRTDVYSLGATLYFALTGRPPVTGTSVTQVLERVQRGEVTPPRQLDPSVSRDLEAICLRALHRDPAQRYASALDLGADIRCALAGLPVSARRYGLRESSRRAVGAHKEAFALGLAALLVMIIGMASAATALYATAHDAVLGELRRKVIALASTATMLVDPTLVQAVHGPDARAMPEARHLADLLNSIRNRNRKDVHDIWVMRRRGPTGALMEYVANSNSFLSRAELDINGNGKIDENEMRRLPGDLFDATPFPALLRGLETPTADPDTTIITLDGVAISGYAPVIAKDGRSVAVLGVDVAQKGLVAQFGKLDRARWLALSITAALALSSFLLMVMFLIGLWRRSGPTARPHE